MKKKIHVIIKPAGLPAYPKKIPNTLEALQRIVGGHIETVTMDDVVVICNEEGRFRDMPYNGRIRGVHFVGPVILAGVKGEHFDDAPVSVEYFEKEMLGK